MIGVVVSSKLATLKELQTDYSLEDAYLLMEVIRVDGENKRTVEKFHADRAKEDE